MTEPYDRRFRRDLVLLTILCALGLVLSLEFTNLVIVPALNVNGILAAIYETAVGLFGSPELFNAASSGVVLGLLIGWIFDTYKQLQVFIPLFILGGFVFATEFSLQTFLNGNLIIKGVLIIIFSAVVLYPMGIQPHRLLTSGNVLDDQPREYKIVTQIALWSVVALVLLSLVDLYFTSTGGVGSASRSTILRNSVMGGILILLFGYISMYENRTRVLIIGPSKSGKTALMGGLYSDIDATQSPQNNTSREVTENRLESISNKIANKHRVPDWTWDENFVHFSYFERGRIFRKKKTIATLDYGGEMLVGKGKNEGFASIYRKYRENNDVSTSIIDKIVFSLSFALPFIPNQQWCKTDYDNVNTMIGETIHESDVLIFTLPLDDFLEVPIRHGEAPPEYSDIIFIERVEEEDIEQTTYELSYSGARDESQLIREAFESEPGDYYYVESDQQFKEITFNFENLPKISDEFRYTSNKDRSTRGEYLQEYRKIIQRINESDYRDILWTVTMTDLHHYWESQGESQGGQTENNSYQYDSNLFEQTRTKYRNKLRSDDEELTDTDNFLKYKGLFDNIKNKETDRDVYKLFSLWVKNQYLSESIDGIDDWLNTTGAEFVYPVWYRIKRRESDELIIYNDRERFLKCSQFLVDGIEGNQLSSGLVLDAEGRETVDLLIEQLSPLQDSNPDTPIEVANTKMGETFHNMLDENQ